MTLRHERSGISRFVCRSKVLNIQPTMKTNIYTNTHGACQSSGLAAPKRNSLTLAVYIVPCRQAAETHIQSPKAPLQINEAAQQRGYMWIKLTFLAILLPSALTIVGMSVGHGPSLQLPLPRMCSKGSGSASAKQHTERASAHRFLPRTTPTRPSARRALPRCR